MRAATSDKGSGTPSRHLHEVLERDTGRSGGRYILGRGRESWKALNVERSYPFLGTAGKPVWLERKEQRKVGAERWGRVILARGT